MVEKWPRSAGRREKYFSREKNIVGVREREQEKKNADGLRQRKTNGEACYLGREGQGP